jgi:hypothetical protein
MLKRYGYKAFEESAIGVDELAAAGITMARPLGVASPQPSSGSPTTHARTAPLIETDL